METLRTHSMRFGGTIASDSRREMNCAEWIQFASELRAPTSAIVNSRAASRHTRDFECRFINETATNDGARGMHGMRNVSSYLRERMAARAASDRVSLQRWSRCS